MGSGKPTYYYTLSSGKTPVTLSPPLSTIFLLFVLADLLPTLKLFEGSARIWSGFYKAPNMLNTTKGQVCFLFVSFNFQ